MVPRFEISPILPILAMIGHVRGVSHQTPELKNFLVPRKCACFFFMVFHSLAFATSLWWRLYIVVVVHHSSCCCYTVIVPIKDSGRCFPLSLSGCFLHLLPSFILMETTKRSLPKIFPRTLFVLPAAWWINATIYASSHCNITRPFAGSDTNLM